MKARIGTRMGRMRAEGRSVNEHARAPYGALAAPASLQQSFFVPGSFPRLNTLLGRDVRWKYAALKKAWSGDIRHWIKLAKLKPMTRVHIHFLWQEKDRRKDPDNIAGIGKKFILDALVESGILTDDGWDEIAGWTDVWRVQKDNVGVLVTLEAREEGA